MGQGGMAQSERQQQLTEFMKRAFSEANLPEPKFNDAVSSVLQCMNHGVMDSDIQTHIIGICLSHSIEVHHDLMTDMVKLRELCAAEHSPPPMCATGDGDGDGKWESFWWDRGARTARNAVGEIPPVFGRSHHARTHLHGSLVLV